MDPTLAQSTIGEPSKGQTSGRPAVHVRWRTSAEAPVDQLRASDVNWFELEDDPRAGLQKVGLARSTWRVRTATFDVFAKVFHQTGVLDRMKWRLLGSPAEREWDALRRAAERGIPTVRALAVAVEMRAPRRSVLMTATVDDARPLVDVWRSEVAQLRGLARRRAASAVSSAVARLLAVSAAKGFQHRDGHPSNVLVRFSGGSAEALYADLLGASFSPNPVPMGARVRALARLDHSMRRWSTRIERLRFLLAYESLRAGLLGAEPCAASGRLAPDREVSPVSSNSAASPVASAVRPVRASHATRAFIMAIVDAEHRHAERLARQRDRRLRRTGPYFATLRLGDGWCATVVLKLARRTMFPEPDAPDRTVAWWRSVLPEFLRLGDRSTTCSDSPTSLGGARVERFQPRGLWERVSWALRGSPARLNFERCHRTRHRDVSAPLVLAVAERRRWGLVDTAILVTGPV